MRNVLQILPALESGGVEYYVVDLLNAIARQYPDKTFYVTSAGGRLVLKLEKNIVHEIIPFDRRSPWAIYKNSLALKVICEKYAIEHMHVHSRAPAWACYVVSKQTKISYSSTYHGIHSHYNVFKKWYNSGLLRGDFVIAISAFIENHLGETYPLLAKGKIVKIVEGIDPEYFDKENFSEQDRLDLYNKLGIPFYHRLIFMPGRFTKSKGQRLLLEALKNVHDVSVIFAGKYEKNDHYVAKLKQYCLENEIHAHFLQAVDDVRLYYFAAHIVVNNSQKPEAFGRTIAESLSMERPLITTYLGGAIELTDQGKNAFCLSRGDTVSLTDKIIEILSKPPQIFLPMLEKGRQYVRLHYNFKTMIQKIISEVYKEKPFF
jgi:glycosyltransferase involved in cell wall biosynthesis